MAGLSRVGTVTEGGVFSSLGFVKINSRSVSAGAGSRTAGVTGFGGLTAGVAGTVVSLVR